MTMIFMSKVFFKEPDGTRGTGVSNSDFSL
jgi:hypothetical protein